MNITAVKIRNIFPGEEVKAIVSIVIDDDFAVHNIRIIKGKKGRLLVSMPNMRLDIGRRRNIAHPINSKTQQAFDARILSEYYRYIERTYLPKKGVINA